MGTGVRGWRAHSKRIGKRGHGSIDQEKESTIWMILKEKRGDRGYWEIQGKWEGEKSRVVIGRGCIRIGGGFRGGSPVETKGKKRRKKGRWPRNPP